MAFGISAVLAILGLWAQISMFKKQQKQKGNVRDDEYIARLI